MAPPLPRVFGPYYLLARLGQGAAGAAYLAKPLDPTRGVPSPVVIKCLHMKLAGHDEFVRRFRHEAEIAVAVDSPHVAKTYDVGAVGDELYIALEYVPGWTFSKLLSTSVLRGAAPPIEVACGLVAQAARGLHALHSATDADGRALDAVHRDVSPKNIMLGDDGVVRIIDLGLGKSKAQDWQTTAGRIMGSPGYMPNEQIRGESVDKRADVFAIGTVLHELLTGKRYISVDSSVAMLLAAANKKFVPPSELRAGISPAVDALVHRAMSPEPKARTPNAGMLADELEANAKVAPAAALAQWLSELLPEEQSKRRSGVAKLILAEPDEPEPPEPTVVFVKRKGVGSIGVKSGDSMDEATPSMLAPTRITADSAAPMSSVQPSSLLEVRQPSKLPQYLIVAVALIIGFAGGAMVTGRTEEPLDELVEVPTEAPPPPAVPSAAPAVIPRPEPVPDEPPPPPPKPEPTTKRRVRRVRRAVEPPPPPPPPPPPAKAPVAVRLARLEKRLGKLRGDGRDATVTKLLTRVAMVRAAKDSSRVERQVDALEAEVAKLER